MRVYVKVFVSKNTQKKIVALTAHTQFGESYLTYDKVLLCCALNCTSEELYELPLGEYDIK